jgi:hypothetical protein
MKIEFKNTSFHNEMNPQLLGRYQVDVKISRNAVSLNKGNCEFGHNLKNDTLHKLRSAGGRDVKLIITTSHEIEYTQFIRFNDWSQENGTKRAVTEALQFMGVTDENLTAATSAIDKTVKISGRDIIRSFYLSLDIEEPDLTVHIGISRVAGVGE